MIELKTGEDSIFVNENEISSMYRCRGSIGAYSSYTVLIMKNGTRHEVSEEPQNIQKAIQAEKKGEGIEEIANKVMDKMSSIVSENPSIMEYETDARNTWPNRWGELLKYLKALRDIKTGNKEEVM